MGKWFFITFLLVVFSDLSAGSNYLPCEKKPVTITGKGTFSQHASFSTAQRGLPFPRLLCGHLVLPEAAYHTSLSQLITPHFQLNAVARCYEGLKRKQLFGEEPVQKDHFHHLFPFFHFW